MKHIRDSAIPFSVPLAAVVAVLISAGPNLAGEAAKDAPDEATLEAGRDLFLNSQPACGICHELTEAGTEGTIAPNLDSLQPSEEQVRAALREGPGAMPNYSEVLSETDIATVAAYVAYVAGKD